MATRLIEPLRVPFRLPQEPGLVLYMPMLRLLQDQVYDWSGRRNHGTIYGASWVLDRWGWALSFDGVDDYVDCGHSSVLDSDIVTLACWVYVRTNPTSFSVKFAGIGGQFWLEYHSTFNLMFDMWDDAAAYHAVGWVQNLVGAWHFLAGTFDNNQLKIYVDGVLKNTVTLGAVGIYVSAGNIRVGETKPMNSEYNTCPDAIIDEVRVFNRALSPAEIRRLYEAGRLGLRGW